MARVFEEAREAQAQLAAKRFSERTQERADNVQELARPGGIASVNTSEEVARRLDRVTRYLAGDLLPTAGGHVPAAEPGDVIHVALERARDRTDTAVAPVAHVAKKAAKAVTISESGAAPEVAAATEEERAGVVLEKIIGAADFVGIRYLEGGVAASRAVCRIVIRDPGGGTGYGTGSLVSPRLLLTNHHVLESADVARLSAAEFNYQDGIDGQPLQPQLLTFDPDTFFLADPERDFALVAIAGGEQAAETFGFNRLIEAQGKAIKGDFVTIVQHPRGERKQIALRENKIVDELELFLHYSADTEPGSSGSPVFNDQWEIVALHHASVKAREAGELGEFLNEGTRASRILAFVREQSHDATRQSLVDGLCMHEQIVLALPPEDRSRVEQADTPTPVVAGAGAASVTIPLVLTIGLGEPAVHTPKSTGEADEPGGVAMPTVSAHVTAQAESLDADDLHSRARRPVRAGSAPRVVAENAPIIRLHSKEDYPPVRMDDWLDLAKLYWYEGGKRRLAFDGSASKLFAQGPTALQHAFNGRRIGELTRPWDSLRPKAGDAGFALVTDADPKKASPPAKGPVQVFYEHVEGRYVTYWLYFPWSTVPRRIPGRDVFDRLGLEAYDAGEAAELAEAEAALQETYPGLVEAASPSTELEGLSPGNLVRYVHAWFGPRWPVLHEGDWEGVAVELGSGKRRAAFFQHGAPQIGDLRGSEPPVVNVALGSHASYPDLDPDSQGSPRIKRFETLDEGKEIEIELVDVRSQPWYGFGGAWGAVGKISDETGPLGPGEKKGPRPFAAS
ncbi:MAG TPA: serine protease [Gaiellaceae bacterium]|nr:serine protease [Gaiellaceae bacterium]